MARIRDLYETAFGNESFHLLSGFGGQNVAILSFRNQKRIQISLIDIINTFPLINSVSIGIVATFCHISLTLASPNSFLNLFSQLSASTRQPHLPLSF